MTPSPATQYTSSAVLHGSTEIKEIKQNSALPNVMTMYHNKTQLSIAVQHSNFYVRHCGAQPDVEVTAQETSKHAHQGDTENFLPLSRPTLQDNHDNYEGMDMSPDVYFSC